MNCHNMQKNAYLSFMSKAYIKRRYLWTQVDITYSSGTIQKTNAKCITSSLCLGKKINTNLPAWNMYRTWHWSLENQSEHPLPEKYHQCLRISPRNISQKHYKTNTSPIYHNFVHVSCLLFHPKRVSYRIHLNSILDC